MKKILLFALVVIALYGIPMQARAGEKRDAKIAYVLQNLKLDKTTRTKFVPLLEKYYEEVSNSKDENKALKDKLAKAEAAGKLTPAQCDQLFESKQAQETAELSIRKKYYAKFKTILSAQQAYSAIKLCNDKVSSK